MGTLWLDYGHIGFRSSKPATTWLLQQEQASLSAPDQDFFYAKAESYEDQFEADGNPDTGITDTNFGNVSRQGPRSTERRLQFSAHYDF